MTTAVVLGRAPSLARSLARGALRSPVKRPSPQASYPRTRLVLRDVRADAARLSSYHRLCGFPPPAGDLPLPYPHVLAFPLTMRLLSARDFPLPLPGLIHTSITLARHAALPATAAYELGVRVDGLSPHHRGTEATLVTEAHLDGNLVWESRSTYLARHRTDHGPASAAPPSPAPLPVLAEWPLPAGLGRAYAALSGDRNPIHLHPLTARLFGFPRAIAHGMWTAARCLAAYGDTSTAQVRFRSPVPLPGTVRYGARGDRFELRDERGRLHLSGRAGGAA
ncbi:MULTISPECIES: MaoC family dehydratase [Streptomyces]|uniref:MaoC family dehydratase n=1 Tax=Streptomyces TaxID=1883 RepID=UPI0033B72328